MTSRLAPGAMACAHSTSSTRLLVPGADGPNREAEGKRGRAAILVEHLEARRRGQTELGVELLECSGEIGIVVSHDDGDRLAGAAPARGKRAVLRSSGSP